MGVKFGEIDSNQIVENEFRILVLEAILEKILSSNPRLTAGLDMDSIRADTVEILKKKYSNSGICWG